MVHFIWPVMTVMLFSLPLTKVDIHIGCDALSYLLDNIYIRFGTKLYRHIVGIPMGTNCAPLVADLFYTANKESLWILLTMIIKLMLSRLLIRLLSSTSMTYPYFEGMVNQIYPPELQLKKPTPPISKPPFYIYIFLLQMDLFLLKFMINAMTDFDIVNFPFRMVTFLVVHLMVCTFRNLLGLLESAIMLRTSTSEIKYLTAKFLQQSYWYHKLRKTFSKL